MARFTGCFGTAWNVPQDYLHLSSRVASQSANAVARTISGTGFAASVSADGDGLIGGGAFGAVSVAWIGRPEIDGCQPPESDLGPEIARNFHTRGSQFLDSLVGAFAIAVFDADQVQGLIATDRMGICPVYFLATDSGLAFGSEPALPLISARKSPEVNPQAIFDYLFCHVVPAPHSVFKSVHRLLPGECLEFRAGRVERRRYWEPRFVEDKVENFERLRLDFMQALRSAVTTAMDGARCGSFLSGGTDSSTIAGLMTEVAGEPAHTFSIGFDAAGFDEMEYARLASRHFGTRHHEYYVTPDDIVDAVPRLAGAQAQPFGNSSALPTFFCAKLARDHGVERLLGGDGGDELFGGNARYAKQQVFSYYDRLPASLRSGLIQPACRRIATAGKVPLLSKFVSYVEQASVPMPERLESYNLLNRLGVEEVLTDDLLAQIDVSAPIRLNRDAYNNRTATSLINRMLALDFKTTLADNDLPKVMQSCALAGVPVAFPMLDHRVVDFSLSLQPKLKLKGTRLRYFFKEALRGFLPDEIINKRKHGFGLPFGEWAVRHAPLRELTFESLNSLKRRGWVRPQHIDRLKDDLLPALPNYYGSMAWLLMMLEQWMQRHVDAQSQVH